MYGKDTDLIFPLRALPRLRQVRGPEWQMLVDRILAAPEASVEALAFSLMMVRLASCLSCTVDSYRALRGCTQCAELAARRYRGDDSELLTVFESACAEIAGHLADREPAGLPDLGEVEVLHGW